MGRHCKCSCRPMYNYGFDAAPYGFTNYCFVPTWRGDNPEPGDTRPFATYVPYLAPAYRHIGDPDVVMDDIWKCKVMFHSIYTTRFAPSDISIISDWVHAGGRLYIAAEYQSVLGDIYRNFNEFLIAIGSSMRYGGGQYDNGYAHPPANILSAGIAQGLDTFTYAATGLITGGTPAFGTYTGNHTMAAVEAVGNGCVFAIGDGNALNVNWGVGYEAEHATTCTFVRRLHDWSISDIV